MSNILVPLLRDKPYVQLSPTSTAPRLSDRQEHPFFMRLVESGDSLIAAIFDMLRKLSASYVQIIYDSQDTYSEPLRTVSLVHSVLLFQIGSIRVKDIQYRLKITKTSIFDPLFQSQ